MADSKYGRLFTLNDLKTIMVEYGVMPGADKLDEALRRCDEGELLAFPADEPLFLLRGEDKAAPFAIASAQPESTGIDYAQAALNAGATERFLGDVWKAAATMRDWQAENPDRVKVPDA